MSKAFFHTSCPSCGAQVDVCDASSVLVICPYCNSYLKRQDETLTDSGMKTPLLQNWTPIQIGSTGVFEGQSFTVLGCLQVHYDAGAWNEWYISFADGSNGWLSESGALHVLTRKQAGTIQVQFERLKAGRSTLKYKDNLFTVADMRRVQRDQLAAAGELPISVDMLEQFALIDLRSRNLFMTLEESAPNQYEIYFGRGVRFADLQMSFLRSQDEIRETAGKLPGKVEADQCPKCGGSVQWVPKMATQVVCSFCGSKLDFTEERAKLLEAGKAAMSFAYYDVALKLGCRARLDDSGLFYTLIGIVVRCGQELKDPSGQSGFGEHLRNAFNAVPDGEDSYYWTEYLFFHPHEGFKWLVYSDRKWSISETLNHWPQMERHGISFNNQPLNFKTYYTGSVVAAAGAFFWNIKIGQTDSYKDYSFKNQTFTAEFSENELNWSRQVTITREQLESRMAPKDQALLQRPEEFYWDPDERERLFNFLQATYIIINIPFVISNLQLLVVMLIGFVLIYFPPGSALWTFLAEAVDDD